MIYNTEKIDLRKNPKKIITIFYKSINVSWEPEHFNKLQ